MQLRQKISSEKIRLIQWKPLIVITDNVSIDWYYQFVKDQDISAILVVKNLFNVVKIAENLVIVIS
jgi:hypothetical protein